MSLAYRIMYRLGATPWEFVDPAPDLVDLVEGAHALAPGSALDLGCGSGRDVEYLARHGWTATGIDDVPLALSKAAARVATAGLPVTLRRADISRDVLTGSYSLLVDIGCLHNLNRAALVRALSTVDRVAAPGATLLSFAFEPGGPKPGPVGFTGADLKELLPGWDFAASRYAPETPLRGRMRSARPHYYRMVKAPEC